MSKCESDRARQTHPSFHVVEGSTSVKLLLHGFAMLERSASLLNRKANTHCVRSVALSSCRGACLGQRLPVSTSWTGYISNHNITGVEKGPARTRPRTLWQLLVRLCPTPDYRSLSLRLSDETDKNTMGPRVPLDPRMLSRFHRGTTSQPASHKRPIHFGPRHGALVSEAYSRRNRQSISLATRAAAAALLCPLSSRIDRAWDVKTFSPPRFRDIRVSFGHEDEMWPVRLLERRENSAKNTPPTFVFVGSSSENFWDWSHWC